MTRRQKRWVSILFLVLAGVVGVSGWCLYQSRSNFRFVQRGGSSHTGDLTISAGNVFVETGKPGVLFGTVTKPGGREEIAYLILFRHGPSSSDLSAKSINANASCDRNKAESKASFALGGREFEVAYRIQLDDSGTHVASETITVPGETRGVEAGQVLLIDLRSPESSFRREKLILPPIVAPVQSQEDVEQLANATTKSLASQSPVVRAFLRGEDQ